MPLDIYQIALSPLDEDRFDIPSARASGVTIERVPEMIAFCREHGVTFLIARSRATDLNAAQAMERQGFLLMDTLVYWTRSLRESAIPPDTNDVPVRLMRSADGEQVIAVAVESFRDYFGHYHADERLERTRCDAVYTSWAEKSCSREMADEVLVADLKGSVAGFATLRMDSSEEGEGVLFGVAPTAQGRGIYRSLMIRGMEWCAARGAARMVVSTQITNTAVQKVWARLGFELSHANYTFHRWFPTR